VIPFFFKHIDFENAKFPVTTEDRERYNNYYISYTYSGSTLYVSYTASSLNNGWIGVFQPNVYTTNTLQYISALSGSVTLSLAGLASGTYYIDLISGGYVAAQATLNYGGGGGNPTSGTTGSVTTGGGTGDPQTWLNEHNSRRSAHGVPSLSWSTKLAGIAQGWANTMASQNNMYHSGRYGVGENIAYGYTSVSAVLVAWADAEAQYYNAATQQCSGGICAHYTQVLWAATNLVGCGSATSSSGWLYYCCNYIRPGNCNNYNWQQTNSVCPYFDDSSI